MPCNGRNEAVFCGLIWNQLHHCGVLSFTTCLVHFQIQKLCDRVASSTLLDDRRDAVRALKSLSKVSTKFPEEL